MVVVVMTIVEVGGRIAVVDDERVTSIVEDEASSWVTESLVTEVEAWVKLFRPPAGTYVATVVCVDCDEDVCTTVAGSLAAVISDAEAVL